MNLETIEVQLGRCRNCASTELLVLRSDTYRRSGYQDGKPYDRVIFRRCRCKLCGHVTMLKSFEFTGSFAPAEAASDDDVQE